MLMLQVADRMDSGIARRRLAMQKTARPIFPAKRALLSLAVLATLAQRASARSEQRADPAILYPNLGIPLALDSHQRQRMLEFLQFSEAQSLAAEALFDQFQQADLILRDDSAPELERLNAMCLVDDRPNSAIWPELFKARDELVSRIEQAASLMFAQLDALASEAQRPGVIAAKNWRVRLNASRLPSNFPGADVDLLEIFRQMSADGRLKVGDAEILAEEAQAYQSEITPLMSKRASSLIQARKSEIGLYDRLRGLDVASAEGKAVQSDLDALYRQHQRACRRCNDVNAAYVLRLAATLHADSAREFIEAFHRAAYGNIYPNPFDIRRLFEYFQQAGELKGDQRELVMRMADEWQAAVDRVSHAMVECHVEWMERFFITRNDGAPAFDQYAESMRELQSERLRLTLDALERLQASVPPAVWDRAAAAVQTIRKVAATHLPRRNGPIYRP